MSKNNKSIEAIPVVVVMNVNEFEANMNTIISLKNELLRLKGEGCIVKDGVIGLGSRSIRSMSEKLQCYKDYFSGKK